MKENQVCLNIWQGPLQWGDNHKNVKMGWGHLKIFSRTTGPILTRLGINRPWVEGIQVCSNKGNNPSPGGDNSKRVKIHNFLFLIFFSKTSKPNSMKLNANYLWMRGIQV
jgi:hypothetical protein